PHLRDGLRRSAPRRGHRGRALHAAGAGLRHHRAGAPHAPRARPVVSGVAVGRVGSRAASGRIQSALSYAFLLTLLLFVLFPFFWMLITSFKNEDQMRSLVSMFWPSPFATENYRQLLGKTDFLYWYKNSIFVAVSSTLVATAIGTVGAYALARLRFLGRGSCRARCSSPIWCRRPSCSSRCTHRSATSDSRTA